MTNNIDVERDVLTTTDGDIAVINLKSASQGSWSRFWRNPTFPGTAELIVEQEHLALQFLGDLAAIDRLEILVNQLVRTDAESVRTALVQAQFASITHRFAEARGHVERAEFHGAPPSATERLSLSIEQACGTNLEVVRIVRRKIVADSANLEDLVPYGALLADLGEFAEADRAYMQALQEYRDVSPFAIAWTCFQLGALWGELVPEPELSRAAQWYQKAIAHLPGYVKARVHLAEIYLHCDRASDAEALLFPVVASGDPEVHWRLSDVLNATGRFDKAEVQMQAARSGFEILLGKHLLAFADHGVEFYAGSGNNAARALELGSANLANRPTLRAFEQAYAAATAAGERDTAMDFVAAARRRWGRTSAYALSSLAACP
jgi:tetratricopeptide (TPR) repeat protein